MKDMRITVRFYRNGRPLRSAYDVWDRRSNYAENGRRAADRWAAYYGYSIKDVDTSDYSTVRVNVR